MLILPAAPAAAVSGKQDDSIVYFLWRGNQAARSYNVPANPQSTNQQAVRSVLATLTSQWAGLDDAQRAGWNDYAAANPTTDRFGRTVTPTGLNWYVKANSNRLYMGQAAVSTAPTLAKPAPLTNGTLILSAPATVQLTSTYPDGATTLSIKAQIEVPPTVAWTPSLRRSRFIAGVESASYQAMAAGSSQTETWTSDIAFANGQLVAVWFTVVRNADGVESIPFLLTGIPTP